MAEKEKKKSVDPLTFARQVRAEGNRVTWTTRQETIAATIMVMIMSVIFAVFLFATDQVLATVVRFITGLGQ